MKKIITLFLIVVVAFACTACHKVDDATTVAETKEKEPVEYVTVEEPTEDTTSEEPTTVEETEAPTNEDSTVESVDESTTATESETAVASN